MKQDRKRRKEKNCRLDSRCFFCRILAGWAGHCLFDTVVNHFLDVCLFSIAVFSQFFYFVRDLSSIGILGVFFFNFKGVNNICVETNVAVQSVAKKIKACCANMCCLFLQ